MRHSGLPAAVIPLTLVTIATVTVAAAAVIATVIGRATTVVDRAAAIIVAGAVIVAVGIIVIATAVGSGDRNAGADDAGEGGGCGSAATPIIPAGAEIGGVTRAGSGRQTLLLRRSCDSQRRLDRRQRQCRYRRQRSGAADR